nr:CorA family divalent cation transporter [Rhizobium laguerreae]
MIHIGDDSAILEELNPASGSWTNRTSLRRSACKKKAGFKFEIMQTSFYLGQRTLIGNPNSELPRWRDDLLSCYRGLGIDPSTYFKASRKLGRGNRRTVQHLICTGCSAGSEPSTNLRVNEPVNSHPATPSSEYPMTVVASYIYRNGKRAEEVPLKNQPFEAGDGEFVWIGLAEPTSEEMDSLRMMFGLHPLAVEDALNGQQVPKVGLYGDQLFVVIKTAHLVGDAVS